MNNDNDLHDDDIDYELEGIRRFAQRPVPEFYKTDVRKTRSSVKEQHTERGAGYMLISACPHDTLKRYNTLCHFESLTEPSHDHSFLIGIACQIMESEICRLLAEPSRSIGDVMVKHLRKRNKKKLAEIMEKWLDKRMPAMMGVITNIMTSLCYAIEDREHKALAFVQQYFRKGYSALLLHSGFIASYDKIRSDFRNPANHGLRIFSPREYQDFVFLSLGTASVREWDRYGVRDANSVQEKAVFHHHLAQSKLISVKTPDPQAKPGNAGSELLVMFQKIVKTASPDTACSVEVRLADTLRSGNRDMKFKQAAVSNRFRLGSEVNIGYSYKGLQGDVQITLFDVGTSGKLTVLMPDDSLSEGRITWFPDIHSHQAITLTGMSGKEAIVAVAAQKKADLRTKLGLNKNDIIQEFTGKESEDFMRKLFGIIGNLPKDTWAVGKTEFEITD